MDRDKNEPTNEEYYSEEFLRLQKAGILMQGFFTLGFLYFIYIVYMRQIVDYWSNYISIFFMTMILVCILYALKKPINRRVKKSLVIQFKEKAAKP